MTVFGYLILIRFLQFYFSTFYSVLGSIRKIHVYMKPFKSCLTTFSNTCKIIKNTQCIVFSPLFSVFGNVVKHCLLCLIIICNVYHLSGSRIHHLLSIINLPATKNQNYAAIEFKLVQKGVNCSFICPQ